MSLREVVDWQREEKKKRASKTRELDFCHFYLSNRLAIISLRAASTIDNVFFDLSDVISYAISDPKEVECRLAEFKIINQQLYDAK